MSKEKDQYLLLFRGSDWPRGLSPQEIQEVMLRFKTWYDGLVAEGKVKSGHPLERKGKIVSGKNGKIVVADGPFAESKEAIGGYFLVEVENEQAALEIARHFPALQYGVRVEVRQIAPECPLMQEFKDTLGEIRFEAA